MSCITLFLEHDPRHRGSIRLVALTVAYWFVLLLAIYITGALCVLLGKRQARPPVASPSDSKLHAAKDEPLVGPIAYPIYVVAKDDFCFFTMAAQADLRHGEEIDIEDGLYQGWDGEGGYLEILRDDALKEPTAHATIV